MSPWSQSLLARTLVLLSACWPVLSDPEASKFDCQAADRDLERAWSEDQKAWCCEHAGRGCLAAAPEDRFLDEPLQAADELTPAAEPLLPTDDERALTAEAEQRRPDFAKGEYDCLAGYIRWESGWSLAKKTWCCFHEGRGCTPGQTRIYGIPSPHPDQQRPEPTPSPPSVTTSTSTTSAAETNTAMTMSGPGTTRTTQTSTTIIDCQKATAKEQRNWSFDALKYCCLTAGTGCDKITMVTTTTSTKTLFPPEYDCSVGLSYWKELWSVEKKAYCCDNEKKGCPESSPPVIHYDCMEDLERWKEEWDNYKKAWCCVKEGLGCATTTWEPFDCTLSEKGWSTKKVEWCCAKKNLGCPSTTETTVTETSKSPSTSSTTSTTTSSSSTKTTTSTTRASTTTSTFTTTTVSWKYNCQAHSDLAHEWPDKKREWCCDMAGIGCRTSSPPYDCMVAYNNWAAGWSDTKKAWCCKTERRGCVPTVTSTTTTSTSTTKKPTTSTTTATTTSTKPPHDCSKDFDNWKLAWSVSKTMYCCEAYQRGCNKTTSTTSTSSTTHTSTSTSSTGTRRTTSPYDCHQQYSTWEHDWSHEKKDWCCRHESLGCHNQSSPYDCQAGFNNWEAGWSEGKKAWCCQSQGVACRGGHETTTSQGHHHHHHHHHGATTTTTRAFIGTDCAEGIGNTQEWPRAKKEFCCSYAGIACSADDEDTSDRDDGLTDPFDCYAGYVYTNWEETWSDEKKNWCCQRDPAFCPYDNNHSRPSLYDCNSDAHHWRTDWSVGKRAWCCLHDKKKCLRVVAQQRPDHIKSPPHHTPNCTNGAENWEMAWSMSKKEYCCKHSHEAGHCHSSSFSALFDTAAREQLLQAADESYSLFQTPWMLAVACCSCTAAMAALVALATSSRGLGRWSRQGHHPLPVVPLVGES